MSIHDSALCDCPTWLPTVAVYADAEGSGRVYFERAHVVPL